MSDLEKAMEELPLVKTEPIPRDHVVTTNIDFTVTCSRDDNPVPGTSGWHITRGQRYRGSRIIDNRTAGEVWLRIIADDGQPGNYRTEYFEPLPEAVAAALAVPRDQPKENAA